MSLEQETFDLAIATDWIFDRDFVYLLKQEASQRGLKTVVINDENLENVITSIREGSIKISVLFDRAADTSVQFVGLQEVLKSRGTHIIDPVHKMQWASDKATMHLEFINNGLFTPYTIIIAPYDASRDILLSSEDLACLGRPFIIKPANTTGGGIGVVDGAESLHDVLTARREYSADKYLLQEKVQPLVIEGKRFWFRGYYTLGLIQCAWWNDKTHIYSCLQPDHVKKYKLYPLFKIIKKIAHTCGLSFFSTEISLTESQKYVVVDYVNESCDMRFQSNHATGVPDSLIFNIVRRIARHTKKIVSNIS